MRRALLVDEQGRRERLRRKRTIVFERQGREGRGGAGSTDPFVPGEEQVQDFSAIEVGDAGIEETSSGGNRGDEHREEEQRHRGDEQQQWK